MPSAARFLFLAAAAIASVFAQQGWVPSFSDDFDGKDLDLTKWAPHDPSGRQRDWEVQAYIPGAISVAGGSAHITADRGKALYDGETREYTSGIITTYGTFAQTYGRYEIRCRMPPGKGLEAKFWLLPAPSGDVPSIDIYDAIGNDPKKSLFGNEWGDDKTRRSYRGSYAAPDLSAGFHVVAAEWDKDQIVWFVDGKERFRSTEGVPHQPMYMAVSLSLGGAEAKYPDSATRFPAVFDIDYVRAWKRAE